MLQLLPAHTSAACPSRVWIYKAARGGREQLRLQPLAGRTGIMYSRIGQCHRSEEFEQFDRIKWSDNDILSNKDQYERIQTGLRSKIRLGY